MGREVLFDASYRSARTFFWIPSCRVLSCSMTLPLESLFVDCWPRMLSSSAFSAFRLSLPGPDLDVREIFSLTAVYIDAKTY